MMNRAVALSPQDDPLTRKERDFLSSDRLPVPERPVEGQRGLTILVVTDTVKTQLDGVMVTLVPSPSAIRVLPLLAKDNWSVSDPTVPPSVFQSTFPIHVPV